MKWWTVIFGIVLVVVLTAIIVLAVFKPTKSVSATTTNNQPQPQPTIDLFFNIKYNWPIVNQAQLPKMIKIPVDPNQPEPLIALLPSGQRKVIKTYYQANLDWTTVPIVDSKSLLLIPKPEAIKWCSRLDVTATDLANVNIDHKWHQQLLSLFHDQALSKSMLDQTLKTMFKPQSTIYKTVKGFIWFTL